MRQNFFVLCVVLGLAGCGQSADSTTASPNTSGGTYTISAKQDKAFTAIKSIAIKGRCLGCHDVEDNRFGPAWSAVSARYKNQPDASQQLFESIKNGSGGKWSDVVGENVMPPNSNKVNDQEIQRIVDYILSL